LKILLSIFFFANSINKKFRNCGFMGDTHTRKENGHWLSGPMDKHQTTEKGHVSLLPSFITTPLSPVSLFLALCPNHQPHVSYSFSSSHHFFIFNFRYLHSTMQIFV
jgi:hypothetical protein